MSSKFTLESWKHSGKDFIVEEGDSTEIKNFEQKLEIISESTLKKIELLFSDYVISPKGNEILFFTKSIKIFVGNVLTLNKEKRMLFVLKNNHGEEIIHGEENIKK